MRNALAIAATLATFLAVPALAQTPLPSAPRRDRRPGDARQQPPLPRLRPPVAHRRRRDASSTRHTLRRPDAPRPLPTAPAARRASRSLRHAPAATPSPHPPRAVPRPRRASLARRPARRSTSTPRASAELDALPQIGPVRAAAIIGGRPYATPDDLVAKHILTQHIYDRIKDRVTVR